MSQGRWVSACVDALVAGGVSDVVLSPGSRSTPLVLALLQRDLPIHDVIDERAAAFFALGLSRVGRLPLLLCTSGTAGAHYLPAVMEASASHLPLVVLTADRPPELHELGANQTTDQRRLFGTHARAFVELGASHDTDAARRGIAQRSTRALAIARGPQPGPVHLNVQLRKPLEEGPFEPQLQPTRAWGGRVLPDPAGIRAVLARLGDAKRPLIAAGPAPLSATTRREHVSAIAEALGAPVVADATSQLRFTGVESPTRMIERLDELDADFVLQIGNAPIHSSWLPWVEGRSRAVLAEHAWPDPTADAEILVMGDVRAALRDISVGLKTRRSPWASLGSPSESHAFDARGIAQVVVEHSAPGSLLMVGNSNIARAIDRIDATADVGVLHQRGLSGIDGLIAGAAGASVGANETVTLLLGDVSALHDLGGLMLARGNPVRIVIVHDDGGRIFEKLPIVQAISREELERHFAMKHGLAFEHAAAQFGLDYRRVSDRDSLVAALQLSGPIVIEARVA